MAEKPFLNVTANDDYAYHLGVPDAQSALDIFEGEWASRLPGRLGDTLRAGSAALFEDPRIHWACARLSEMGCPVSGRRVLELGALEGGHTYMLRQAGAREVIAIEANRRAFLRALVLKELLHYDAARFLHGDASAYLMQTDETFDVGLACGLLYHLTNPVELLELLARRCQAVFLWTMYYSEDYNRLHPDDPVASGTPFSFTQGGFRHTLRRHAYGDTFDPRQFRGGAAGHAHWMERDEILGALRHFGFNRQVTQDEDSTWGRALWVVATRSA